MQLLRKFALVGIVIAAAIVFTSTVYAFSSTAATVPSKPDEIAGSANRLQEHQIVQRVHHLVNEERAFYGLPPLSWDDRIATFAEAHSRDIVAKGNYAESFGPQDKGDIFYRAVENAICVKEMNQQRILVEGRSEEKVAQQVVDDWLKDDYSRGNLLGPHDKEGIGVALGKGFAIVTQNLC